MTTDLRIDRYLDGLMSEAEREAFELELQRDPHLRAQIDADRALVASLKEAFDPPAASEEPIRAHKPGPMRRWIAPLGVAAALAIAAGVAVLASTTSGALGALYKRQAHAGFAPSVVCTTPEQFREWTSQRLSVPLQPVDLDQSTQLVGWAYDDQVAPYTSLLLAKAGGQDVVVAMGRGEAPDVETVKARAGFKTLRVFPERVGDLWLYEITPADGPSVVGHIKSVSSMPTP